MGWRFYAEFVKGRSNYGVWKREGGFYNFSEGPPKTESGYYNLEAMLKLKGMTLKDAAATLIED